MLLRPVSPASLAIYQKHVRVGLEGPAQVGNTTFLTKAKAFTGPVLTFVLLKKSVGKILNPSRWARRQCSCIGIMSPKWGGQCEKCEKWGGQSEKFCNFFLHLLSTYILSIFYYTAKMGRPV